MIYKKRRKKKNLVVVVVFLQVADFFDVFFLDWKNLVSLFKSSK
jgi:hypothetical protein